MKKFFRLVSVFAIAGVTFAYTSCTDYSEDIEQTNGRVTTLEGSVATLQNQVTSLQSAVSSLQSALTTAQNNITALQSQLGALEAKHDKDIKDLETAYKAADASLKAALEKQISDLQTKHDNEVKVINQNITALQNLCTTLGNRIKTLEDFKAQAETILPTLATKAELANLETKHNTDVEALNKKIDDFKAEVEAYKTYLAGELAKLLTKEEFNKFKADVEAFEAWTISELDTKATKAELEAFKTEAYATFATQKALEKVIEDLGKVDGRLQVVEADLKTLLGETVPDIYEKIRLAQKAADDAQADATKALGQIDELTKALGIYAEKGKLEATIAALIEKDSTLNAAIIELVAQDEAFKIDIKNLQDKDVVLAALIDSLSQRGLFYDAAIEALQKKDAELDQVDAKHDSLIGVLEATKLNIADFQDKFDAALTEAVKDDGIAGKVINQKVQTAKTEVLNELETVRANLQGQITTLKQYTETEIAKINGIFPDRLTSIVFVPQYYVDGIDAILFETLAYEGMGTDENTLAPEKQSGKVSDYKFNVSAETIAKYRFSPKTVGIDCADWDFVGNVAEVRAVAPEAPIQIVGTPKYNETTGEAEFTVEKKENTLLQEGNKVDIVALKATLKTGLTDAEKAAEEKPVVFSEYERVVEDIVFAKDLAISDSIKLNNIKLKDNPVVGKYFTADWQADPAHEYTKTFNAAKAGAPVYKMAYNEDFDLGQLVATCINKGKHTQLDLAKFGLYYKFSVATSKYPITTEETTTDQQTNIKCVDEVNGIYRTTGKYEDGTETEYNRESIGRTPIVKIELMHGDKVVTRAFVKVEIVVVRQPNITVDGGKENYVYGSNGCGKDHTMTIPVETMRAAVYRVANISHEEFWNLYEVESSVVTKNGKACTVTPPTVISGTTSAGVATKEIVWTFNDDEVGVIGNGAKLLATITLKNKISKASSYPEYVKFIFEFNYTLPDVTAFVDVVPKDIFWKDDVLQANVNRPNSAVDIAANCWFNTPIEKQPWDKFDIDLKNKLCIEDAEFVIKKVTELDKDGKWGWIAYDKTAKGVYISEYNGEVSIALKKDDDKVKAALNSEQGLQAEVAYVATLESGDVVTLYTFVVNFIRPLTLNMPEGLSVIDAKTGGDVIDFDFDGLLVDWRGELVLPPTWSYVEQTNEWFFWKQVCSPADHALVLPGYQKLVSEGYYTYEFETVTMPFGVPTTVYTATIQIQDNEALKAWYAEYGDYKAYIVGRNGQKTPTNDDVVIGIAELLGRTVVYRPEGEWVTSTVTAEGASENAAVELLVAKINDMSEHYFDDYTTCGMVASQEDIEVTYKVVYDQEVSFQNLVSVTYTPAVYEEVESQIVYSEHSPRPTNIPFEQLKEGDRVGCWQWTKASYTWNQPVWEAGQYWFFYGPISQNVVLDLDKVTTDLADKKLPAGASLVQTGNTLKYENVLSPIQYPYHIFIPATVEYGWGTLNSTMTILVKPVATIGGGE
jgi:hypothetical protein